jgi:ParE toxin of type II toxin-antitoxin system, parDE
MVAPSPGPKVLSRIPGPVDPEQPDDREVFIPFGAAGYVARYRITGRIVVILAVRHRREAGCTTEG